MPSEIDNLRGQLRRAFFGEAWHGDHVFGILDAISSDIATAQVPGSTNTIQSIVLHIGAWMVEVARRVSDQDRKGMSPEEDWPLPPEGSRAVAWARSVELLRSSFDRLDMTVAGLTPDDLARPTGPKWTAYEEIHGVIQHALYHLGQVVVLAKVAPAINGTSA